MPAGLPGSHSIQRDIKCKHINARLAENAKDTPFQVLLNNLAEAVLRYVTRLGDTRHLE
jgi:hypothetical protein